MLTFLALTLSARADGPSFWRARFAAAHRGSLAAPAVPQPADGPWVLLVPGTTIGPEFFAVMEARLRADGFRTVVWTTDDLLTGPLADAAVALGAEVDRLRAETGEDQLAIVAECDGGVAARYWAQVLGGHPRVSALVTFVSAHHGTRLAGTAARFRGFPALRDIRPGSPLMEALAAAPFPEGLAMTSIGSCHDALMWPRDTFVVEGATNVTLCDRRDRVGHFAGFWREDVYALVRRALRPQPPAPSVAVGG